MRRLRLLDEALAETDEAAAWYDARDPELGSESLDEFADALAAIAASPRGESLLETVDVPQEIRRRKLRRFPYVLVYQVKDTEVVVLAVTHERRHPTYWFDRIE